jgi:acetyl esterase/lipase
MATESDRQLRDLFVNMKPPQSISELRAGIDMMLAMMNANPPEVGALHEDVELRPGIRADVAVPKSKGPHPVVVYLHGGAWVAGSSRSHRKLAMRFAERGYLTINVDYRLAPEHPFPVPVDDCIFAVKWAGENAKRWNGDARRLAVGGDSAGANLTAAALTSLASERYAGPKPRAALLLYGLFDFPAAMARRAGEAAFMEMITRAYLGSRYPDGLTDPRVSPLRAIRPGAMPPTFLICGTADPLLADSQALAEALKRADIAHELHVMDEMPHAFMQIEGFSGCAAGHRLMFDFLRRTL